MIFKSDISHILITDTVDVAYFSGFKSSNAALLIGARTNRIFTDYRYHTAITAFCAGHAEWKYCKIKTCMAQSIAPFLSPGSRVGFQSDRCTVDEYNKLKKNTHNVRFVSCSDRISDLLMVKQPDEIKSMSRAAAIADRALAKLLIRDIRPGVTELFVARRLERYCADMGSEKPSFDTIVLFGANTALPHGRPGGSKLRRGDLVLVDFGCTFGGFVSDMTRTFVMGNASEKQRRLYSIVREAQQRVCSDAHAGMEAREIDALARTIIDKEGFGKEFGHALGHGVGRRVHEAPRVGSHTVRRLPGNTVITIEPGIYLPKFGGIRIEDMAVLLESGVKLLTHFPKELMEL
jgi:Xaa-Pro aminopeptidase